MYYRYKSKRRTQRNYETILIFLAVAAIVVSLVYFRNHLYFWKFSYNRLTRAVTTAEQASDHKEREALLAKALASCDNYRNQNPLQRDGYYVSARVHYLIGELESGGSLSRSVIDEREGGANPHFLQAIRFVRKGMSLDPKARPDDVTGVILAQSCFMTDFNSREEIAKILSMIRSPKTLPRLDDRRFYGLMTILNGDPESGVQFLIDNGDIQKDEEGKLFLASAYALAKQYTNAIMEYRSLVDSARSSSVVRTSQIGLGKVYFRQSLFKEAQVQFEGLLKATPDDAESKLWVARCYQASGDKFLAKKLCQEILSADPNNKDAAGMMVQL
jgi:tetratricopeptide (TPR) repeat protein